MPRVHNGKHVNWYITSDNTIYLNGLILEGEATYENDATVTGQLTDTAGANITGGGITFSYVASSNGQYKGILPDTLSLTRGTEYWLTITATAQSGEKLTIRLQGPAVYAGA